MLAFDLGQRVADGVQEVFIGVEYVRIEIELDNRLSFADRR